MKDIAFLLHYSDLAVEFQIRCGMPASDFLLRLYELMYDEQLVLPEGGLAHFNEEAISLAKQRGVKCGYELDSIRGALFGIFVSWRPGKKSLDKMLADDPAVQDLWQKIPILRVIMEFFIKTLKK